MHYMSRASTSGWGGGLFPREQAVKAGKRGYDQTVKGQSACFVWFNCSKESLTLDVKGRL